MSLSIKWRAAVRCGALALGLAVAAGCTMVRLGYSQLDTLALWKADDYFDLDATQKTEFRKRFGRLHEWHRYGELPDYAAFLRNTRARLGRGVTREDLLWFVDGLQDRYERLVAHASGDAADLLSTLTPAQLEALKARWAKDNRRFVREHGLGRSGEALVRARVRRMQDQAREWVGSLTSEQEQLIAARAAALPEIEQLQLEDRLRREHEFAVLLDRRAESRDRFALQLQQWLSDWKQGRTADYAERSKAWFDARVQIALDLAHTLTPAQQAALMKRLQGYIDDFTQLAERPHLETAANSHGG